MKYYSQYEQDRILREKYFVNLNNGFFIEIGADDGIDKSNTYFFEQLGWNGLCIEPSPFRFNILKNNRRCECLNFAISSKKGRVRFLDITGYGKGLSGIIENYDPRHVDRINRETTANPLTLSKTEVEVNSERLDEVLKAFNIKKVDYCSIDVEGSELEILKSIDFESVYFDIIGIEDNYGNPNLMLFMEGKQFKLVDKIGPDLIFKNIKRYV